MLYEVITFERSMCIGRKLHSIKYIVVIETKCCCIIFKETVTYSKIYKIHRINIKLNALVSSTVKSKCGNGNTFAKTKVVKDSKIICNVINFDCFQNNVILCSRITSYNVCYTKLLRMILAIYSTIRFRSTFSDGEIRSPESARSTD